MRLLTLKTVLAAVDADEATHAALRVAEQLTNAAGASLHVVSVAPPDASSTRDAFDPSTIARTEARIHRLKGDPAKQIQELSASLTADVIVLGPPRQRDAAATSSLGSTALKVVTGATAPCLVAGDELTLPLRRVIVPVDLSDTARGALLIGLSWASALRRSDGASGTTLTALRIEPEDAALRAGGANAGNVGAELERLRGDAGAWAGIAIDSTTLQANDVAACIDEFAGAHGADLIVMGTRGVGNSADRRLGSVAGHVLRRTRVPVLLVPPAIWQSYAAERPTA